MWETRVHTRVKYNSCLECYHYYTPDGETRPFEEVVKLRVLDVSIGGLGIISKHRFNADNALEFTFYFEGIPYQVLTLIKWVYEIGEYYRYGLELICHNNMLFRHLKEYVYNHLEYGCSEVIGGEKKMKGNKELGNLVVYSSEGCKYCKVLKDHLKMRGFDYIERDINKVSSARKELMGRQILSLPAMVYTLLDVTGPIVPVEEELKLVGFEEGKVDEFLKDIKDFRKNMSNKLSFLGEEV